MIRLFSFDDWTSIEFKASITFTKSTKKLNVSDKVSFAIKVNGYDIKTLEWRTKEVGIVTVGRNTGKLKAVVKGKTKGRDTLYVRVKDKDGKWVSKSLTITVSDKK